MSDLSEAEQERAANIARNEEFMRSVGIIDAVAEAQKAREDARKNRVARPKREKNQGPPAPGRLSSRNAGKEKKSYLNDLPPSQLEAVNPKSRARKAEQIIGGEDGILEGRIQSDDGPKRRRKQPLPYTALYNKIPKQRPVAAETICGLFSDRELRVLVKHNGLREGDHSKISKSKSVAQFYNTGQTGIVDGMDFSSSLPKPGKKKKKKKQQYSLKAAAAAPQVLEQPIEWERHEEDEDEDEMYDDDPDEGMDGAVGGEDYDAQEEEEEEDDVPAVDLLGAMALASGASGGGLSSLLGGGMSGGSLSGGLSGGGMNRAISGALSGGGLSEGSMSGGGSLSGGGGGLSGGGGVSSAGPPSRDPARISRVIC